MTSRAVACSTERTSLPDMGGEVESWDERSRMRISDDDRHRVAELLREAAGDGRLDLTELDDRLGAAYAAKTYGDLVPITADLPTGLDAPASGALAPQRHGGARTSGPLAMMGGSTRRGAGDRPHAHGCGRDGLGRARPQ